MATATQAQKERFIKAIAPLAQKAYRQFGKPLPSVCIAMAAVECKWGLAGSCAYNSYLGQKVGTGRTAVKYWNGSCFNAKTKEVTNQQTGQLATIRDNFRAYDSIEQCIFNYYELLNTSLYKKVISGSSYEEQMKQIKASGYMTSITEVNTCIDIIRQNNLTQYDDNKAGDNEAKDKWAEYYPAVDCSGSSIVQALGKIKENTAFAHRKKIAAANGVLQYKGTTDQNLYMLKLLKEGKLKRA